MMRPLETEAACEKEPADSATITKTARRALARCSCQGVVIFMRFPPHRLHIAYDSLPGADAGKSEADAPLCPGRCIQTQTRSARTARFFKKNRAAGSIVGFIAFRRPGTVQVSRP